MKKHSFVEQKDVYPFYSFVYADKYSVRFASVYDDKAYVYSMSKEMSEVIESLFGTDDIYASVFTLDSRMKLIVDRINFVEYGV